MNDDHTLVEETVRRALRDAADHAPMASPVPLADAPTRVTVDRRRRRARALVATGAVAVVIALAITAVVVNRDAGAPHVHVGAPSTSEREIPVAELAGARADLIVYLQVAATDDQVAAFRTLLDTSPDVDRYAFVDRDAAWTEFSAIYSECNPDLVDSVKPADLPVSFRIIETSDPSGTTRLVEALNALPGFETVTGGGADAPIPGGAGAVGGAPTCESATHSPVLPAPAPSTAPPTLPAAGEQPPDPTTSHDAVVAAFTQAWDGTSTIEQRRAAMQASDQLAAALDRARAGNEATIATMHAVVGDVTFVAPDRAAVVYHLEFQGLVYPDTVGSAVLDGGVWKVGRETVCDVLRTAASVSCPAS